jgi:hypothetical protein
MISSTDAQKAFGKIQHPSMIKSLKKLIIEEMYLNTIKGTYDKPIYNILIYGEKLKAFPLKSQIRQGCLCLLSPLLFNIVLEFVGKARRQEKEIERI